MFDIVSLEFIASPDDYMLGQGTVHGLNYNIHHGDHYQSLRPITLVVTLSNDRILPSLSVATFTDIATEALADARTNDNADHYPKCSHVELINTAADLRLAQTAHYYSKVDEYND